MNDHNRNETKKRSRNGRRKLPDHAKRNHREVTNFNDEELAIVKDQMKVNGFYDTSSYLRHRALNEKCRSQFIVPEINKEVYENLASSFSLLNMTLKIITERKSELTSGVLSKLTDALTLIMKQTHLLRKELRGNITKEGIMALAEQLTNEDIINLIIKKKECKDAIAYHEK